MSNNESKADYAATFADGVRAYELERVAERRRQTHSPQNREGTPAVPTDEWKMPPEAL